MPAPWQRSHLIFLFHRRREDQARCIRKSIARWTLRPTFVKGPSSCRVCQCIWMLFTAFFPFLRFNAALPRIGQWFTNFGIAIEDQNSKIGYFDKIALTVGRRPYPLFLRVPPLSLDIGQCSLFQTRHLPKSNPAHATRPPFILDSSASNLFTTSAISIARA